MTGRKHFRCSLHSTKLSLFKHDKSEHKQGKIHYFKRGRKIGSPEDVVGRSLSLKFEFMSAKGFRWKYLWLVVVLFVDPVNPALDVPAQSHFLSTSSRLLAGLHSRNATQVEPGLIPAAQTAPSVEWPRFPLFAGDRARQHERVGFLSNRSDPNPNHLEGANHRGLDGVHDSSGQADTSGPHPSQSTDSWTPVEDDALRLGVTLFGQDWKLIFNNSHFRCHANWRS